MVNILTTIHLYLFNYKVRIYACLVEWYDDRKN
jgi:hypothetical protein